MRLLAFAFTIVFVWTGPKACVADVRKERGRKDVGRARGAWRDIGINLVLQTNCAPTQRIWKLFY